MKAARVLSEVDVLEAEISRRATELRKLQNQLSSMRGDGAPMVAPFGSDSAPSPTLTSVPAEQAGDVAPLAEVERSYVLRVLRHFNGNRTHAARALGMGTNTLWRKLKAWGEPPARTPHN